MKFPCVFFSHCRLKETQASSESVSSLCPPSPFLFWSFPSDSLVVLQVHVLCLCEVISCLKETGWKMWFHLRKSIKKKRKSSLRLIQGRGDSGRKHYLWLFKNNSLHSVPLLETRTNLFNITANLTSKGCTHVKALFNCDKEYTFMPKPLLLCSSGQSP